MFILSTEEIDKALEAYPQLLAHANQTNFTGGARFTPRSTSKGSPVEYTALRPSLTASLVWAIQQTLKSLNQDQRLVMSCRYGWHYTDGKLIVNEPNSSTECLAMFADEGGYFWSPRQFYRDLGVVRDRARMYLGSVLPNKVKMKLAVCR